MPPLSLFSAVLRVNYLLSSSSGLSFTLQRLIINQMHLKINLAILRLIGMLISSVQRRCYGNNLGRSELLAEVNAWGHLLSCVLKYKTPGGNKSILWDLLATWKRCDLHFALPVLGIFHWYFHVRPETNGQIWKTPPQLIYFCLAGSNCSRFDALIMGLKRKITRRTTFALSSCPCRFSPK